MASPTASTSGASDPAVVTSATTASSTSAAGAPRKSSTAARPPRVGIVGGGVIGLAIARRLAMAGLPSVVFEQGPDALGGASGGNSGIACTGFDAPHDSLEFKLIRRSLPLLQEHLRARGLPSQPVGSLVIARTPAEAGRLQDIVAENHAVGDKDVRVLSREELTAAEPCLAPSVLAACWIPGEVIVDSWLVAASYMFEAVGSGLCTVKTSCKVQAASLDAATVPRRGRVWHLDTSQGRFEVDVVINCGGNFGDVVQRLGAAGSTSLGSNAVTCGFTVRCRRGQYAVLQPKDAGTPLLRHPLQPLPTDTTKGVFVFPTLYNHVVVGPTSDLCDDREGAVPDPAVTKALVAYAQEVVPALKDAKLVATYVGLRPATEHRDYQIHSHPVAQWVTVGGIRSTGLTASLGIADYVVSELVAPVLATAGLDVPVGATSRAACATLPAYTWRKEVVSSACVSELPAVRVHVVGAGADKREVPVGTFRVTHPLSRLGLAKL